MKITMMGVPLSEEEIDAIPEPAPPLEYHFAEATVSPEAMQKAMLVVPEEVWKPLGLLTWLTRRANEAFKLCKVGEYHKRMGRLTYVFSKSTDHPILQTVILDAPHDEPPPEPKKEPRARPVRRSRRR